MKKWFPINISVLFIAITCALSCVSQAAESIEFQKVDPNQVPAVLMMLSDITKANYEKIKTWQGNIVFQNILIYHGKTAADLLKRHAGVELTQDPNELMTTVEGTTEFKIDLENNRLFAYMNRPQPMIYTDPDKERVYTSLEGPMQYTIILTPEYEIESYPDRRTANNTIVTRRSAIKREPGSLGNMTGPDPRECFNVGSPIWLLLSQLSQSLQYKKEGIETFGVILEKGKTAENNAVYRIQITSPGESYPVLKFILKEEMGFNPTYIEVRRNGLLASWISTDFVEIGGIFLPSKRQEIQYDDSGFRRGSQRTINNAQINAAIPDKTFSVHGCGLSDGDKFVDRILDKEYTYQAGKLIAVKKESK